VAYLEFSSVIIRNFKTFTGEPVSLWLSHKKPGLRFIKGRNEKEPDLGSNGAAKSSLFAALSWCLFGQTINGLRTPDIIPWSGVGSPNVRVTLYRDNKMHMIVRSPKSLTDNNSEISQVELEQILGFGFEVFRHTVLFGQGQDLFFDLSPKDKMSVFVSALALDRWDDRADAAAKRARGHADELAEVKSAIAAKEAVLAEAQRMLTGVKGQIEAWEGERQNRAKDLKKQAEELDAELAKLHNAFGKANLAHDSAGTELKALNVEINKLVDKRAAAQSEVDRQEMALTDANHKATELEQELHALTGKDDACPTCGQSLKGTALARHKADLLARLKALQARIDAGVPNKVAGALRIASAALTAARNHALAYEEKADTAQSALNLLVPRMTELETKAREARKQLKERDAESNPHRAQAATLRKNIGAVEAALSKLDDEAVTVETKMLRTAYWAKGFKAVRLHLLEELLQELEMATNAMLPESGLHNWTVNYSMEKETKKGTVVQGLNVTVLSPGNTKPVKWESWSGGEAHRLRVVGALALSEVLLSHAGVNTNLEVLDEPTRDLSVEGVQDLCEFLARRAQQLDKDIFLTGHNVIESAHFAETITVVKAKGAFSYIEK
jgi:DNA repair exonuclease SbcCD ATPase subunit